MDLMSIRRGMLAQMGRVRDEIIELPNENPTNSSDIDTYFSQIINGWLTEPVLLMIDETPTVNNEFIGCFSAYLINGTKYAGFSTVWRYSLASNKYTAITRSNYVLHNVQGRKYRVIRFNTYLQ